MRETERKGETEGRSEGVKKGGRKRGEMNVKGKEGGSEEEDDKPAIRPRDGAKGVKKEGSTILCNIREGEDISLNTRA